MCGGGDPPPKTERDRADEAKFNDTLKENKEAWKKGPGTLPRSLTDVCCCLIFIAAIVGFCGASAYGWSNGDPSKLLIGWDSDQNGCGYSDKTTDYEYLYWPESPGAKLVEAIKNFDVNGAIELLNKGVCVKECPTAAKDSKVDCYITTDISADPQFGVVGDNDQRCVQQIDAAYFTTYSVDITKYAENWPINSATGKYPYRYDTRKLYGFCVPDFNTDNVSAISDDTIKTFKKLFNDTVMSDKLTSYLADIAYSWMVILLGSVLAIVLGYIYLLLIRCMGALIVWLSIFLIMVSLIGGGAYVYSTAD